MRVQGKVEAVKQHGQDFLGWISHQSAHTRVEYIYAVILACVSVANIVILANAGKVKADSLKPKIEAGQQVAPELKTEALPERTGRANQELQHRVKLESAPRVGNSSGESSKAKSRVM